MANPFISIERALELAADGKAILLDCRWFLDGRDAHAIYLNGHIPGAHFLDMEKIAADLSIEGAGRHPLPSIEKYTKAMGDLGISNDSVVVLYDSDAGSIAARIWWMNRQLDIDSYIISGGIQSYRGELEVGEVIARAVTLRTSKERWENALNTEEFIDLIAKDPKTVMLDARNHDRYTGEFEPVDPRAGHIPGAYNLPTRSLMIDGTVPATKDQIQQRLIEVIGEDNFASLLSHDQEVVVSCGSGITACHLAIFVEEALGRQPLLYNGSFSAWSKRTDLPVLAGCERGTFPLR